MPKSRNPAGAPDDLTPASHATAMPSQTRLNGMAMMSADVKTTAGSGLPHHSYPN